MTAGKRLLCAYHEGMFSHEPRKKDDYLFQWHVTAHHEAGHAVIGYALGFGCARLEMRETHLMPEAGDAFDPDKSGSIGSGGWFKTRAETKKINAALLRSTSERKVDPILLREAIAICAGPAAERRFCFDEGMTLRGLDGSGGDHRDVDEVIAKTLERSGRRRDAVLRLAWRRAQSMVNEQAIWTAIQELAYELLEMDPPVDYDAWGEHSTIETMSGARFRTIMKGCGLQRGCAL